MISISDYAFYNNQLTSVVIPDSVTTIGQYAFNKNNLLWVYIGSESDLIETTGIGRCAFCMEMDNPNAATIYNNSGKKF